MQVKVKNRYTGVVKTYTVATVEDAVVEAAMEEDGVVVTAFDYHNYYRALVIHSDDTVRLGEWTVVKE